MNILKIKLMIAILVLSGFTAQAQTFSSQQVWNLIDNKLEMETFRQKGFKEVYGGPQKEGGGIYLLGRKKSDEFLFVYTDQKNVVTGINYYVPQKAQYLKLRVDKKLLLMGEEYLPQGRTEYNGKLYYQITFLIKPVNRPSGK